VAESIIVNISLNNSTGSAAKLSFGSIPGIIGVESGIGMIIPNKDGVSKRTVLTNLEVLSRRIERVSTRLLSIRMIRCILWENSCLK
jgi:hypothetical protein